MQQVVNIKMPVFCFRSILLLAMLCAVLCMPSICSAQSSPPLLSLTKTKREKVRVVCTLPPRQVKRLSRIEILRAYGQAKDFSLLHRFSQPKRRQAFVDEPKDDGAYRYKAALYPKSGSLRWSRTLKIRVQPSSIVPPHTPLAPGQKACPAGYTSQVLNLVNQARSLVTPLKSHKQLSWAARSHTIDMAERQNFSHDGWYDFIRRSGFRGSPAGENIALGYTSPQAVMNGWLGSSGHRANILNTRYRYIGIGCVIDQYGRFWWTQNFGG